MSLAAACRRHHIIEIRKRELTVNVRTIKSRQRARLARREIKPRAVAATLRRMVALALATAATAGAMPGLVDPAHAANMPDWAADFDSAGDAFEGGGGGGGGGAWWPNPLHPSTVSGGGADVPTTCMSRPTPDGEELTCSPSYPAGPLPPASPRPDYGVSTRPGGKGLGDREDDVACYTHTRGTRPPTEDEKSRYHLDPTQRMRDDEQFAREHAEWQAEDDPLKEAWMNTREGKAQQEAFDRAMQTVPGSAERDQAMDDWSQKLEESKTTPEWKAWRLHGDKEPVPYTAPLQC